MFVDCVFNLIRLKANVSAVRFIVLSDAYNFSDSSSLSYSMLIGAIRIFKEVMRSSVAVTPTSDQPGTTPSRLFPSNENTAPFRSTTTAHRLDSSVLLTESTARRLNTSAVLPDYNNSSLVNKSFSVDQPPQSSLRRSNATGLSRHSSMRPLASASGTYRPPRVPVSRSNQGHSFMVIPVLLVHVAAFFLSWLRRPPLAVAAQPVLG